MTKGSASASDAGPNSRDLILDAARSLVTSQGYDGMSVSDLCARSGLPASSIYYHFGNKLGVLAALLDRTFQELHAQFPNPASFREGTPWTGSRRGSRRRARPWTAGPTTCGCSWP